MTLLKYILLVILFASIIAFWWLLLRAANELYLSGEIEKQVDPINSSFAWFTLCKAILRSRSRSVSVLLSRWILCVILFVMGAFMLSLALRSMIN
jgi:hypothetical protein